MKDERGVLCTRNSIHSQSCLQHCSAYCDPTMMGLMPLNAASQLRQPSSPPFLEKILSQHLEELLLLKHLRI